MPVHDRYARLTPFERTLPDPGFPDRHFAAVEAEARERGVALADPGVFAMLGAAITALEELKAPGERDDEALTRLAALLFHAFHHHRAGRPVLLVRTGVVRYLVDTPPADGGRPTEAGLPASAYVQLPQHLVWTRADEQERPRSLDGFFWTLPGDGTVHLLAVAGLLEERTGFTVIPLPGVPLEDAPLWSRADMRSGDQTDFATDLPGSEHEGLYEVRTAGELLKLGARLDAYLTRFPDAVRAAEPVTESPENGSAPRPSALVHSIVTLD
jgi:hypothetical protein